MKKIIILAVLFAVRLCGEPLKLTNKQADELLGALQQIGPGLTAANTTKAARDILALRPISEAYAKGIEAARVNNKVVPGTKLDSREYAGFVAEISKLQAEVITVDLVRF